MNAAKQSGARQVRIGEIKLGGGAPLVLIAGLNVIENESATLAAARAVAQCAARHGFPPPVFKASADKANRSSLHSYRGPGFKEGLRVLAQVKAQTGLPVTTDVHEAQQAAAAAEVADCLQIPAFLCRQTDLVLACAQTGRAINIKKGGFVAPESIALAVEKARAHPNAGVFVTERGAAFGYNDLVADMRALVKMRRVAPVCFDATHSAQLPGAGESASGGEREMVAPLARAAVAAGIDALFVEVHPQPERAPCDGPSQITPAAFDALLAQVRALDNALRQNETPA